MSLLLSLFNNFLFFDIPFHKTTLMSSRPRLLSTKTVRVQSNPPHVAMVALLDHSVLEDSDELDDWDMQHLIDHHQEDEVVDLDTISRLSSTYTYNNVMNKVCFVHK
ncbi:hypothetical protein NC652_031987 [Populus alba x Populus x berolinensis]|nr:hypothetical protein NC652_031987 [Populus alba x Populus x berolinensis]